MKKIICLLIAFQMLIFSYSFSQQIVLKATAANYQFKGNVQLLGWENSMDANSFTDRIIACVSNKLCPSTLSTVQIILALSPGLNDFRAVQLFDQSITSAELVLFMPSSGGPFELYRIRMEEIKVRSVQEGGSVNEPLTIKLELQPVRIAWRIQTINPNGSIGTPSKLGWDFARNIAFMPANF